MQSQNPDPSSPARRRRRRRRPRKPFEEGGLSSPRRPVRPEPTRADRRPSHEEQRPSRPKRPEPPRPPAPEGKGSFAWLLPELRSALAVARYEEPTPIQQQCIPHLLEGRDLMGCAQTGTGKTAAFALPILQHLHEHQVPVKPGQPRVLVLAPTRELAAQIGESFATYGRYLNMRHVVIFGGVNQRPQVDALRRKVELAVATPGRLLDLMQQGEVNLDSVEVFVLDEADRMLDMGFLPDIRRVIGNLPEERQTLFFSATLGRDIIKLARSLVQDPVHVTITPDAPAVERINQKLLFVDKGDKDKLLVQLLQSEEIQRALVFTRMKHAANRVAKKLANAGINAVPIHGNKSQNARTKALEQFRTGEARVMVATDIAARGIDVDGISHVINYNLPNESETYVHRIGRTARAGAEGEAWSFCEEAELGDLRDIERLLGKSIPVETAQPYHSEVVALASRRGNVPRSRPNGGGGFRGRGRGRGGRRRG